MDDIKLFAKLMKKTAQFEEDPDKKAILEKEAARLERIKRGEAT